MGLKKRLLTRSQITPFMIIGLILLILVMAASYITYLARTQPFELKEGELSGPKLASAFSLYVDECIKKEGKEPLESMGIQGGTLLPSEPDFIYYNKTKVKYLCYSEGLDPAWSCVNSMLTKGQMEYELSSELKDRLEKCVDLGQFRRFVDDINAGEMSVHVSIAKDDIVVTVDYPVNMTFRESIVTISNLTSTLDYPLGRLYSVAENIVNAQAEKGYFDIDDWMARNGADIVIEKHRPYPDILYILKKGSYTFQFALQDLPSSGQFNERKKNYYGCCYESSGDTCFKNANPLRCVELGGDYNPNVDCSCASSYEPADPCTGDECNDCPEAGKKSGESWCAYDTITGTGYDYVGSRQYKQSCINGSVLVEECRDYREELCTEGVVGDKTTAVCRPNRWSSCFECNSETCCEDSRQRDCYWDSTLSTQGKCIPQVPPGLRFWENQGADICLRGNQETECEGFSCPQSWLDSAARYCYAQGDCGNYRNINDKLSSGGFYETDIFKKVNETAYPPEGLNKNPIGNGTIWKLNLGFDRESADVIKSVQAQFNTLSLFVASLSGFFNELSKVNPSSYANPFAQREKLLTKDFSVCGLWVAPIGDADCSLCSGDQAKPCTEYRCKSIGESCQFEIKEGIPVCEKESTIDFSLPSVQVDVDVIPAEYTLEKAYLGDYDGYKVIEPVRPHKPFTFGVKTDEDTRCTISLTPRIEDYSLQTVLLGDSVFRKSHNITLRMPPRLVIPDKLSESLNLTSTDRFLGLFYNIRRISEAISNNLRAELEVYSRITGKDFTKEVQPKVSRISSLVDSLSFDMDRIIRALLTQFDQGGYYLFFDCSDRAGNRNRNQVFIQFIVNYGYVDNEAPVIVSSEPQNNGKISPLLDYADVKIYLDEPAECRYYQYDVPYQYMNHSFSCPIEGYQLSPVAGGTYECQAQIEVPFVENRIFIKCADHPAKTDSYVLKLSESRSMGITGADDLRTNISGASLFDYVNIDGSRISSPAGMLDRVSFEINVSDIKFDMYLDDKKECRYSEDDKNFEDLENSFDGCILSNDLKKGVYFCSAGFSPKSQLYRGLGNYTLNIAVTGRNKTVDVNPERISIDNGSVNIKFDKSLSGEDSIELSFMTPTAVISIDENAQCSFRHYGSNETTPMSCTGYANSTVCGKQLDITGSSKIVFACDNQTELVLTDKTYNYNIKCRDANLSERNINSESYEYILSKADELKILSLEPAGVINTTKTDIRLKVSEDIIKNSIQCGYNDNPYAYLRMGRTSLRDFEAELPQLKAEKDYTYFIKCTDKFGGIVTQTTRFKAVI